MEIIQRVLEAKEREIRVSPCLSNRASELGHSCERYLVYCRTRNELRKKPSVDLQFIFDAGNAVEQAATEELKKAGFKIIQQQRDYEWKKFNITGHLDFKISIPENGDKAYPVEVKSLNQFDWEKINTLKDMFESKKYWIKKWPAQLTLYLLLSEEEWGLFYLKNKQSYRPKAIWMELDLEYGESLLKKAERINNHVAEGTLPERISGENGVCDSCDFLHLCMPDRSYGEGLQIVDDERLLELLNQREELKTFVDEYYEIDKQVKTMVEGKNGIVISPWLIEGKYVDRAGYTVKPSRYWNPKITKIA